MHNYNIDLFYIIKQVLSPFLWNKAIPLWYNKGKVHFLSENSRIEICYAQNGYREVRNSMLKDT